MPSICFSSVCSSYLTPALNSAKPKPNRNNLNLIIKYVSSFAVILRSTFMWGSGNVPGQTKRAAQIPCPHPSFLPKEVSWAQTQQSGGDTFTSGLLGKKWPGHPAKACHFWDKYDFLSGHFYEGHSERLIYSGNSLADLAVQQLLPPHCKQQLALEFSEEVYKRDSVFIWRLSQCWAHTQMAFDSHLLHHTQPKPTERARLWICLLFSWWHSLPSSAWQSEPAHSLWEGQIGRWTAVSRGNMLSMKTFSWALTGKGCS